MKKILLLALGLILTTACNNDDDITVEPPEQNFDYNENLNGDLANTNTTPTVLAFVGGQNTVTATQSSSDVDYFTFTIPASYELTQIIVEDYQSSDDAGFIGIVNGNTFLTNAASTGASDLLGGLVYGVANRGNDILASMGGLNGAQGFTGALPAGDYSIWLNQTGASSETTLNFRITTIN